MAGVALKNGRSVDEEEEMGARRGGTFFKLGVAGLLVWGVGSIIAGLLLGGRGAAVSTEAQWAGLTAALVSGLIAGGIMRTYPHDNVLPLCWTLAGAVTAFGVFSALGSGPAVAGWGTGIAAVGYLGLALRRRDGGGGDIARIRVTTAEMRRRLDAQGLLLTSDEVYNLKMANHNFRCEICKSPKHMPEQNWLEGFMRCPHNEAHIFHAKHFEAMRWRCPKDRKGLIAEPPAPENQASGTGSIESEASDER